jgi:hypothetical protein
MSDPHPSRTALLYDGSGLVVNGAPDSIELVLADARRQNEQNEQTVHLLSDDGMVEVDATLPWELEGVRASG